MKRTLLFTLACLFLGFSTPLKSAIGGPDSYGYIWVDSLPVNWVDITQIGNQVLGLADDNSATPIQMSWNFSYYGNTVNSITVGSNGWIGFDYVGNVPYCADTIPFVGGYANNFLAPLLTDLNFTTQGPANPGKVYVWDNGFDTFIISYIDVPFWNNSPSTITGSATFQVILSGVDNSILIQYDSLDRGLAGYTANCPTDVIVGIESPGGIIGLEYLRDTLPTSYQAVRFTTDLSSVNYVSGTVFLDANGNGQMDPGDYPYPFSAVQTSLPGYSVFPSQSNGEYLVAALTGTYSVSPQLPYFATSSIPASYTISHSSLGFADTLKHFALQFASPVNDLCVSLTAMGASQPGRPVRMQLTASNVGTTVLSDTLQLEYDPLYQFQSSTPMEDQHINNILQWYPGPLLPGTSRTILIDFRVDTTAQLGSPISHLASVYPFTGEANAENNQLQLTDTVVTAYDPNDKLVEPSTLLPGQATARKPLTYTIRFQNTGNAPAYRVILRDTLSALLDAGTLRMIDASHPYRIIQNGQRTVWRFDPIVLPDSNANEPASHGFVKFQIQPVPGLQHRDSFQNRAAIYFDYNAPIITNWATVVVDTLLLGIEEITLEHPLEIWPQPTSGTTWIQAEGAGNSQTQFSLLDLQGRVTPLIATVLNQDRVEVNLADYQDGLYFLRMRGPSGKLWVKKVLILQD